MTPRDDFLHDCGAALDHYLAASAPAPVPTPPAGTILFDAPLTTARAPFQTVEFVGSHFDGTPDNPPESARLAYGPAGMTVTVKPGDRYGGSTGERCLLRGFVPAMPVTPTRPPFVAEGDDFYIATTLTLLSPWQNPSGWSHWCELHESSNYQQASWKLSAGAGSYECVQLNAGYTPGPTGPWEVNKAYPWARPLVVDEPRQVVISVRAESGPGGALWVDSRRPTEAIWHVEAIHNGPTLQRGNGATLNYPLYGLYRGASAFTSQLRVGHIRHATTRALAEAIFS